jgi:uncharacterized protein (TIGR03435 family)
MRSVEAVLIAAVFAVQVGSAQGGPSFEVASIRPIAPGTFDVKHLAIKVDGQNAEFGNRSLYDLVAYAFHVNTFQVIGPKGLWAYFTIQAKLPDGATTNQVPDMLAQLLAERFQMKFHKENREFSVYALVVDPKGAKLTPAPPDLKRTGNPDVWVLTLDRYAETFGLDRPVINETGLQGEYLLKRHQSPLSFDRLRQAMGQLSGAGPTGAPSDPSAVPSDPSGITSILSQLGLKVVPRKRQLPAIIIDRIETSPTD